MAETSGERPRRIDALPTPVGWYCVGTSSELAAGSVATYQLAGEEVVCYRTASGRAVAVDPWCPHLGAHFGHGGRVIGDTLECPFHGFRFDTGGACVATAYGSKPPPAARAGVRPLREVGPYLFVFHGPPAAADELPLPALEAADWSAVRTHLWHLAGHPQETTENSVDLGHFSVVHGYHAVREEQPLEADGPVLRAGYSFRRARGLARSQHNGRSNGGLQVRIGIAVHGLGCSIVETEIGGLGLRWRQFVLPTPLAPGRIALRIGLQVAASETQPLAWFMRLLPRRLLFATVLGPALAAFRRDVLQDFAIWQHKRYLERPALADGDGPIAAYRRWCRQFYPTAVGAMRASASDGPGTARSPIGRADPIALDRRETAPPGA